MHALVLLAAGSNPAAGKELHPDHERFIDELIAEKRIVLGGDWKPPVGEYEAAYLLSCPSLDDARAIAASDPFVSGDAMRFEVIEWELVGFYPDAVDRDALVG